MANYYLVAPLTYTGPASAGFTYESTETVALGSLVEIPLGKRSSLGVVVGKVDTKPTFTTKPITRVLDIAPLPAHLLQLGAWMEDYYYSSAKAVWGTMLPAGLEKKRRIKVGAAAAAVQVEMEPALTKEQVAALKAIRESPLGILLQGVTSSGKTRVYLELASEVLAKGQDVIILVPEIALTPQTEARFRKRFGDDVIVTHSHQTEAERHLAWTAAHTATSPKVVLGPRSALFLPLKNPGLIVVDECHETSYKQEQNPRYQAVTVAGKLAQLAGAKLILGSATPGLWEVYLAEHGRLKLVKLTERANQIAPDVAEVVDLRDREQLRQSPILSESLLVALAATMAAKRQSLLFLNRRGSASSHICGDCGYVFLCPHCELPLTFHADHLKLICHYCNYRQTPAALCPECGSHNLKFVGSGTKRVEAEVQRLFPTARIARLDKDSATMEHLHQVYADLAKGQVDVLIGTQMIAKGLDLPAMDLVGVVSADTMLHFPDYTASERSYQLISQVSGRTGRGDRAGQIILQTYTPDHPAIRAAANHDFWGFVEQELPNRQLLGYPPYRYLLKLSLAGTDAEATAKTAAELAGRLRSEISDCETVGPAPAFYERLHNKYHWQIIVKAARRRDLFAAIELAGPQWASDLDPVNLL